MSLRLGDTAPDFTADTTEGPIRFHEWIADRWAVLFSHPRDFTPVCTTELGYVARLRPEFDRRNVKVIGLSIDPLDAHRGWAADIKETQGYAPNFPIIADPERNFDEILRVIDSLQLTDAHRVATPVNWKQGEDVIIVPAVSDEEARARFPKGWRALKPYLRLTPQPK